MMENELQLDTPYDSFVFAIRSPVTREKYVGRLAYFMSFVGITEGNRESKCNTFGQKCKVRFKMACQQFDKIFTHS